jgi:hypothetical protein
MFTCVLREHQITLKHHRIILTKDEEAEGLVLGTAVPKSSYTALDLWSPSEEIGADLAKLLSSFYRHTCINRANNPRTGK